MTERLLIFCALVSAVHGSIFGSYVHPTLRFNTTLTCDLEPHNTWCFQMFFYELDITSPNDPLLFLQGCTEENSVNIYEVINGIGGDGGWGGMWQKNYEITRITYHTCVENQDTWKTCSCSPDHKYIGYNGQFIVQIQYQYINYGTYDDLVNTNFHLLHNNYDLKDETCRYPEIFKEMNQHDYKHPLPEFDWCDFEWQYNNPGKENFKIWKAEPSR